MNSIVRSINSFIYISFLLIISSCFSEKSKDSDSNIVVAEYDSTILSTSVHYSNGFEIEYGKDYKMITVTNPWQHSQNIEYSYLLVNHGAEIPKNYKADEIIRIPVDRVVCLSTTHIGYLSKLNKLYTIEGVSGNYVCNDSLSTSEGYSVVDVGYEEELNYELLLSLDPDLVFVYNITGDANKYINKLKDLGISVVIIGEYLETSPLAKAEWIKMFAAFYNEEEMANLYFHTAEEEYNLMKKLTEELSYKPKVLTGMPWKDSWYLPGGNSYLAKLIHDAGGNFIWSENNDRESFVLDYEAIYEKASDAEYWINIGQAKSKEDITDNDERLELFAPYKKDNLYNNNKRTGKNGGLDYWETGSVEPHIILKDLIKIFHPEILKDHDLYYYHKISD